MEQLLSLFRVEEPIWYAVGGRCALDVSINGGETPVVVSGVSGDISMALASIARRRSQRCEPIVRPAGLRIIRFWVGIFHGGG